jgi:HEAT repeat protein
MGRCPLSASFIAPRSSRTACLFQPNHHRGTDFHLFKFGVPDGTASLAREGLHDEVLEVRQFAAAFFVRHPSAAAIPDLTEALTDGDAQVRSDAAEALAKLGPGAADALPQLKACLNDPVAAVRANAAQADLANGGETKPGLSALEKLVTAPKPGGPRSRRASARWHHRPSA